jgi:DNA-binding beta-propeller fold protein YncE
MNHHQSTRVSYSVFCLILLWLPLISGNAQETSLISVPAPLVRELTPPSTAEGFLRPEGVFVDNRFAEVFVSDPGHNRVVAFDTSGLYKFEFSCADIFGTPEDVVVDSRGFIYVLGSTGSGKGIYRFDYDGLFLNQVHLSGLPDNTSFKPVHLCLSESDEIFAIDGDQRLVCSFNTDGVLQSQFQVLNDVPDDQRRDALFGAPRIAGGLFYLPVSTFGSVFVYDLEGNFVRNIGDEGADIGKLNFPVAVAVSADSLVVVLDKHRYNVLCFTITGKFVGEFGGMGYRAGWFYHPNSLAMDNFGRCYITQIYLNLVQVCDLPKVIAEKAKLLTLENSQINRNKPVLATKGEEVTSKLTALLLTENYLSTTNFTFWRFYHA